MTYWIHYRLVHREDASFAGGNSFFFPICPVFLFFCPLSISCISASFFHLLLRNICHARGAVYIHLIVSTSASVFSLGGLTLFSLSISSSILFCTLAFNFTPTQSLSPSHLCCIPPSLSSSSLHPLLWGHLANGLCLARAARCASVLSVCYWPSAQSCSYCTLSGPSC